MRSWTMGCAALLVVGLSSSNAKAEEESSLRGTMMVQVLNNDSDGSCGSERAARAFVSQVIADTAEEAGLAAKVDSIRILAGSLCRAPMAVRVAVNLTMPREQSSLVAEVMASTFSFRVLPAEELPVGQGVAPATAVASPQR